MKKIMSKILSAAVCTGVLFASAAGAAAETINVEPTYPIHGNRCATISFHPELDREVNVNITQCSPEGDYTYYKDAKISGDAEGSNEYTFILEGKDDSPYKMEIGVPKYKGSSEFQKITYDFTILNTDNIEDLEGYIYTFTILRNDDLEEPEITVNGDETKNENNVITRNITLSFPASDTTPGDVNFDGLVNLYDIIEIARYLMNSDYLTPEQLEAADYNGDKKVNLYDAIDIAKMIMSK